MTDEEYEDCARRLYPLDEHDKAAGKAIPFIATRSHMPIVSYLGKLLISIDDEAGGESFFLYGDTDGSVGFLVVDGYDIMSDCRRYKDVAAVILRLERSIKWMLPPVMVEFLLLQQLAWNHSNAPGWKRFAFVAATTALLSRVPEQAYPVYGLW